MRRSASVVPDLSSASERVSEIVSTAMLSGMNCFCSWMEDVALYSLVSRTRCSVPLRCSTGPGPTRGDFAWTADAAHRKRAAQHPGHAIGYNDPAPNVLQACTVPC